MRVQLLVAASLQCGVASARECRQVNGARRRVGSGIDMRAPSGGCVHPSRHQVMSDLPLPTKDTITSSVSMLGLGPMLCPSLPLMVGRRSVVSPWTRDVHAGWEEDGKLGSTKTVN